MNLWNTKGFLLILSTAILTLSACGSDRSEVIRHMGGNEKYPGFANLLEAPAAVQNSGQAVVRLENGTGIFVTYAGKNYLMTNEHVFGTKDCAREGAYIEAYVDFQKGKNYRIQNLHVFPQAADKDVDVAFYRFEGLDDNGIKNNFQPARVLELKPVTAQALADKQIHIIGHPYRSIKKWTSGVVLRSENGYSVNTVLTAAGNSGSAVVNDNGELVAIHHSSNQRVGELTMDDFLVMGYDSPTELLITVLEDGLYNAGHLDRFTSITTSMVSLEDFLPASTLYLNAHQRPVLSGNQDPVEALLQGAEAELNSWTTGNSEDFMEHALALQAANDWFQCNRKNDEMHLYCLNQEQRSRWLELSRNLQEVLDQFPGNNFLEPVTWNVYEQFQDENDGCREALSQLEDYLHQSNRELDFTIAGLLARFAASTDPVYGNIHLSDFLENYSQQDYYWYDMSNLIYAVGLMTYRAYELETAMGIPANQRSSLQRIARIYSRIAQDENLSVGARLTLDRFAYAWNVLQW